MGKGGGVGDAGLNVFAREGRIAADDFFAGQIGGEVIEHHGYHDARAPNAGPSLANERIHCDVVLPVHGFIIQHEPPAATDDFVPRPG